MGKVLKSAKTVEEQEVLDIEVLPVEEGEVTSVHPKNSIVPVDPEEILDLFSQIVDKLAQLELYKRSIKKPYKHSFFIRRQIQVLMNNFKKAMK